MRTDIQTDADVTATEQKLRDAGKLAAAPKGNCANTLPMVHSAAELYHGQVQELRPLIDGLLYDGLTLLVAKPKEGKSWLALQLSIAIAGGRPLDGVRCLETGKVLFVALEEPAARTRNRLHKVAPSGLWLEQLNFVYEIQPLMSGGAEQLAELIQRHRPRVVVIDTFTAFVRAAKKDSDVFRGQYEEINRLRQICADAGICGLLIHHTRKGNADGPIEAVAGTGGITAAADTIWLLRRRPGGDGTLDVTGREMEQRSFALHFSSDSPFGWQFIGEGQDVALSPEREEILELLRNEAPLPPSKIALLLRKNPNTIRGLIQRLHQGGYVSRDPQGRYALDSGVTRNHTHTLNSVNSVNESERTNQE